MFEDKNYKNLVQENLEFGLSLGVDIRQASVYYDATIGTMFSVAKYYSDLEDVFQMVFLDSATGEYLDRRAKEHNVYRNPATPARYSITFTGVEPNTGERFFTDNLYFKYIGNGILEAEDKGEIANNIYPGTNAVPVYTIEGLTTAVFGSLIERGNKTELDFDLRNRIQEKIAGPAENGNLQHYKTWCEEVQGIGRARMVPLWNGPNTVKSILINTDGLPTDISVVERVQEYVDPGSTGLGEGVANMGNHFTAISAISLIIKISFTAVLATNVLPEQAKSDVESAVKNYLKSLTLDTPPNELPVIRINVIGSIITGLSSIIDYFDLRLNNQNLNIEPDYNSVGVLGEVIINV